MASDDVDPVEDDASETAGAVDPEQDGDADGQGQSGSEDGTGQVGAETSRHERLDRVPTTGVRNSLRHWPDAKNPIRMTINVVLIWLVRYSPVLRVKNWVLRRLGTDVGEGVSLALTATPDVFWPELITLEDHAIVGYDATLLCHEFLQDEYRTGEVVIGERAMIGAGAIVLPGVHVGADARVAANSLVTEDVPPGTTVAGVPAEPVKTER